MCDRTGCKKPINPKHWVYGFNKEKKSFLCNDCWFRWRELVDKHMRKKTNFRNLWEKFYNSLPEWRIA